MRILAIETSCDETGVCVMEAEGTFGAPDFRFKVLGDALLSQIKHHIEYGGVFPDVAKREHARALAPLMKTALTEAHMYTAGAGLVTPDMHTQLLQILDREDDLRTQMLAFLDTTVPAEIDTIAVTTGPGLEPALWQGVNAARALATAWHKPLVAVNHMEGHFMLAATTDDHLTDASFPMITLLISGAHCDLILVKDWGMYELLGQTRDDAIGEAFDKVARLLELPYPGGPQISRLAALDRERGEAVITLPRPMIHQDNYDFSFAGLKTETRKIVQSEPLTEERKMHIARAFEDAAVDVLVTKTLRAVEEHGVQTVVVGGGVSANSYIKTELKRRLDAKVPGVIALFPPLSRATDNAVMIALPGVFRAQKGDFADIGTLRAYGNKRMHGYLGVI